MCSEVVEAEDEDEEDMGDECDDEEVDDGFDCKSKLLLLLLLLTDAMRPNCEWWTLLLDETDGEARDEEDDDGELMELLTFSFELLLFLLLFE